MNHFMHSLVLLSRPRRVLFRFWDWPRIALPPAPSGVGGEGCLASHSCSCAEIASGPSGFHWPSPFRWRLLICSRKAGWVATTCQTRWGRGLPTVHGRGTRPTDFLERAYHLHGKKRKQSQLWTKGTRVMNKVGVNAEMTADELLINCFQIWRGTIGREKREAAKSHKHWLWRHLTASRLSHTRDPDPHWLTQMSVDAKSVTNAMIEQRAANRRLGTNDISSLGAQVAEEVKNLLLLCSISDGHANVLRDAK